MATNKVFLQADTDRQADWAKTMCPKSPNLSM